MISTLTGARRVAFSIAVLLSVTCSPSRAATDIPLAGSYKYVGGEAQLQAMYVSVEGVVKKMSAITRGIARKRLRKPNMPAALIEVRIDATNISVARTGRSTVVAPRNGTLAKWHSPEGAFTVKHVLDGRTLLETLDGKNSHSTNRFSLDDDGVTMEVHTEITSSRLPAPVAFALTYRKQ